MAYAVYSTTAAAPLLWLGLQKIARTPRPRLEVGYKIMPHYVDCYTPSCELRRAELNRADFCRAELMPRWDVRGLRPLGNALYLDRLLAGGTVGEALPLANLEICVDQANPLGGNLDVCG